MPADLLTQDWEIRTKSIPVYLARSLMHIVICYTSCGAPVHSQRTAKIDDVVAAVSNRKAVAASPCEASRVAHRATATERTCRGVCAKRLIIPVLAATSNATPP